MPAPPRIYGHHQHEIADIEHILNDIDRSAWIEGDTILHAQGSNLGERAMKMRAGLLVNDEPIRARVTKGREVALGLFNHQVHIEKDLRPSSKRFDDVCTEGDRRDVASVHNIDMEPICPRGYHTINLLSESRDIRGED